MRAHLFINKGRFAWSGYQAQGDPAHMPHAIVAETPCDFIITNERVPQLYLMKLAAETQKHFTPEAFVLAARSGWFGIRLIEDTETDSRRADVARRAQPRGRRRLVIKRASDS